jgi:hypothetical protein
MFRKGNSRSASNLSQLTGPTYQPLPQTRSFNGEENPERIVYSVAATQPGVNPSVLESDEFTLTTSSSFTVHSPLRSPSRQQPASPAPLNLEGRDRSSGLVVDVTDHSHPRSFLTSSSHSQIGQRRITSYVAPMSPIPGQQPILVTQSAPPPYFPPPAGLPELSLNHHSSAATPHRSSAPAIFQHSNGVDIHGNLLSVSVAGSARVNGQYFNPTYLGNRARSPVVPFLANGHGHHTSPNFPPSANGHLPQPYSTNEEFELSYYEQFCNDYCSPEIAWAALAFFIKFTLSTVAGGASALNATVNPSGGQPSDIGEEWWDNLSTSLAFFCILNGCASLIVNFVFAYTSIPAAALKIRKNLLKYPQTTREIVENGITITLGTSAAVATAAIAYNAFSWTSKYTHNEALADIVTAASLAINFTTRYVGVRSLINSFRAHSDEELMLKKELSEDLGNIHADYKVTMQSLLTEAFVQNNHQFNETTLVLFLKKIIAKDDPDFVNAITPAKALLYKALHALEVLFAATIGLAALPTFTQLGYNGINILVTKCGSDELAHLDRFYRGLIGITPGVATAMLYAVSTLDLPRLLVNIVKELYEDRRAWPIFVFVLFLTFNILASGSMQNVAEGVESKEDRIFDFLSLSTFLGVSLVWLNRLGGGITNARASFQKLYGSPDLTDPKIRDVDKLMHDFNTDHRFQPDTRSTLQAYSQFRRRELDVSPAANGYALLEGNDQEPQHQMNGFRAS